MAMDIGAVTPFPYALREREYINDFIEELCGARLTYNYHRIGGVSFDMPKGWDDKVLKLARSLRADARRVRPAHHAQRHLHEAARQRRHHHRRRGGRLGPRRPEPARARA